MPGRNSSKLLSEEEYVELENKTQIRHEFNAGHVFAMTGASDAHNIICGNIFASIYERLKDGPCFVYAGDMKLKIESARSYYYPDIMVSCEEFKAKSTSKSSPVIIFEVLSPKTAPIDRREKLIAYKGISTLREYVIIYQDRQRAEIYRRDSDQRELETLSSEDVLTLESMPGGVLTLPMSTIYRRYNPPGRVKESEAEYEFDSEFMEV